MDKAELLLRTKQFALRILKLVDHLPNTIGGRPIGNQLVRSGTSVGANYRAACRARSRAEFAAKIGAVAEEADESLYWLELVRDGDLLPRDRVELLLEESNQLTAIFTEARRTTTRNQTSNLKNLNHEYRIRRSRPDGREHGAPPEGPEFSRHRGL